MANNNIRKAVNKFVKLGVVVFEMFMLK